MKYTVNVDNAKDGWVLLKLSDETRCFDSKMSQSDIEELRDVALGETNPVEGLLDSCEKAITAFHTYTI